MKTAASFEANSSVPLAKIERALFMMLVFHIEHPHCRRMGEIGVIQGLNAGRGLTLGRNELGSHVCEERREA